MQQAHWPWLSVLHHPGPLKDAGQLQLPMHLPDDLQPIFVAATSATIPTKKAPVRMSRV
jgi:hypothetical protein